MDMSHCHCHYHCTAIRNIYIYAEPFRKNLIYVSLVREDAHKKGVFFSGLVIHPPPLDLSDSYFFRKFFPLVKKVFFSLVVRGPPT